MSQLTVEIRPASERDAAQIADVHAIAWRGAYAGLIPHKSLQTMIARRHAGWWKRAIGRGTSVMVVDFGGAIAGYCTFGLNRARALPQDGEIYELYLRPEYQGLGFGRSLFESVRAELAARNLSGLAVQVLSDNGPACAFYKAMGGRLAAKSWYRSAGKRMGLSVYTWPELT